MTDTNTLHQELLRPAVLHILRAAGFHSSKPSVLDTLTDLCARHLLLLAQCTAQSTYDRTALQHARYDSFVNRSKSLSRLSHPSEAADSNINDIIPHSQEDGDNVNESQDIDIKAPPRQPGIDLRELGPTPTTNDVLSALSSICFFNSTLTASEEAWRETLRRPLEFYPAGATREKEIARRDAEDTQDVREFVDWCTGDAAAEMRRVAGVEAKRVEITGVGKDAALGVSVNIAGGTNDAASLGDTMTLGEHATEKIRPDDYLAQMKKKYSRTGDGARYAGTVLGSKHGRDAVEDRGALKIEGGPESLREWKEQLTKRRRAEGGTASEKK